MSSILVNIPRFVNELYTSVQKDYVTELQIRGGTEDKSILPFFNKSYVVTPH